MIFILIQTKPFICDIDFIKYLRKTCETFAGRTLFKIHNPRNAVQNPQPSEGRSLHTPNLNCFLFIRFVFSDF